MSKISTRNLQAMPTIPELKRLLQSLAVLDAILSPQLEYRYYSFNAHWAPGEMMGSMSNGSGDEFFALFNCHGAYIKGFDHESATSQLPNERHYAGVPREFTEAKDEPAFAPEYVSFCLWRFTSDVVWSQTKVSLLVDGDFDGSEHVLELLDADPATYQAFAANYYERGLPIEPIRAIYSHVHLTNELVMSINGERSLSELSTVLSEIGYPG